MIALVIAQTTIMMLMGYQLSRQASELAACREQNRVLRRAIQRQEMSHEEYLDQYQGTTADDEDDHLWKRWSAKPPNCS